MTKEELLKEGFDEVDMATGDAWDFDENPIARGVYMMMQEEVGNTWVCLSLIILDPS